MRIFLMAAALASVPLSNALARDAPPPQGAKPLSELLQGVEKRPDFQYIDEVDWDHGAYKVEYYTQQGAEVKIRIDSISGKQLR